MVDPSEEVDGFLSLDVRRFVQRHCDELRERRWTCVEQGQVVLVLSWQGLEVGVEWRFLQEV